MNAVTHYVTTTGPRWVAACGVNNQRPKPGTPDQSAVTCRRCLHQIGKS